MTYPPMLVEMVAQAIFEVEQDPDDPLDRWPLLSKEAAAPYLNLANCAITAVRRFEGEPWHQFRGRFDRSDPWETGEVPS